MGIWDILTKPIKLTSELFYWHEPLGYRLSLRGDLLIRVGVALAVWAGVSGLLWLLFAFNVKPPELTLAMFVALFIGLGPACLALFSRRNHVSGSIWVYDDHLIRQRSYISLGLFTSWKEVSEWPNASISRCIIIPAHDLGKSFSVMLLTIDSQVEMIGIPKQIRLKELARHFTEAGIPVEKKDAIPARYTEGFSPKAFAAMTVVGVLLFSSGLGLYLNRVPGAGQKIVRENRPPNLPEFPRPGVPAQAVPNPFEREQQSNEPANTKTPPSEKPVPTRPGTIPSQPGMFPNPVPQPMAPRFPNRPGGPRPQPGAPAFNAPPNLPNSSSPTSPAVKGNESKLIGNPEGGVLFHTVSRQGEAVLGFEYSMGSWAGEPAIRGLTLLHERSPSRGRSISVMAKEGYAVGGLKIDAPRYVSAVQIIFYRLKADGQLDPQDSYTSEWLGKPSGKAAPTVDGAGKKVIGIYGRRGAVLDALGLVFE